MSAEARAIRSVAVLGAGIVGLSAALAFARALPQVRITLIETPLDPAAPADRLPGSLPSIHRFHDLIGLPEAVPFRAGAVMPRLGFRFENWSADGERWIHAYGDVGMPAGSIPFHQLWARAHRAGEALPYHRYAAAAVLAESGKFAEPLEDPRSPLATYDYALRLDPQRYRAILLAHAERVGIPRLAGTLAGVERREDAGVAALLLDGDRRIEADLFLDCAGPAAPLLSQLSPAFESWAEVLPCNRLTLSATPTKTLSSVDAIVAEPGGWMWSAPLPDRTLHVFADNAELQRDVRSGEVIALRTGRRPEPWVRNVLALGDAAVVMDPLEGTNLALAQSAIARALELLPGRDCHPLELREYNRRTALETSRVRDFVALHYLRSGRTVGALWRRAARQAPPPALAHLLRHFVARGRLPFHEEELFSKQDWFAVLLGLGMLPEAMDALASAVDAQASRGAMERLAAGLAAIPAQLPPYREAMARRASR